MIASPPPSKPHPENCPACQHRHLGGVTCFHSTSRTTLCMCRDSQKGDPMTKENGKDRDGFENVEGNPTTTRARKVAKAFAPSTRPKEQHLPGLEPKTIPAVHTAIEEYVEARDNRMELTKIEVEKKGVLLAAMKAAGITEYGVDGRHAERDVQETVKANIDSEESEESEELKIRGMRPSGDEHAVNPPPGRKGRRAKGKDAAAGSDR